MKTKKLVLALLLTVLTFGLTANAEKTHDQIWDVRILTDNGGFWIVKDTPFVASEPHDHGEGHDHSAESSEDDQDDDGEDDDGEDDEALEDDASAEEAHDHSNHDHNALVEDSTDPKAHHDAHPQAQAASEKPGKIKMYFCQSSDELAPVIDSFSILDKEAPMQAALKTRGKFDGIKGKKRNLKMLDFKTNDEAHSFDMTMLDTKSDTLIEMVFYHESGTQYSVSFNDGLRYEVVKKESRAARKFCNNLLKD